MSIWTQRNTAECTPTRRPGGHGVMFWPEGREGGTVGRFLRGPRGQPVQPDRGGTQRDGHTGGQRQNQQSLALIRSWAARTVGRPRGGGCVAGPGWGVVIRCLTVRIPLKKWGEEPRIRVRLKRELQTTRYRQLETGF